MDLGSGGVFHEGTGHKLYEKTIMDIEKECTEGRYQSVAIWKMKKRKKKAKKK
jgi:hypothetical protein